jgi:hypothetical protein
VSRGSVDRIERASARVEQFVEPYETGELLVGLADEDRGALVVSELGLVEFVILPELEALAAEIATA